MCEIMCNMLNLQYLKEAIQPNYHTIQQLNQEGRLEMSIKTTEKGFGQNKEEKERHVP